MNLVYSQSAVDDLGRLREFIATWNPAAAARIGADLVARIGQLREFPLIGLPVLLAPDPDTIRDLIAGKYVVRYAVQERSVIVLRVWHQMEDRGG